MKIKVSHYEFDISEPFSSGHVCTEAEAKALNILRSERIRGIVARRLSREEQESVLIGQALVDLREAVSGIDKAFYFQSKTNSRSKNGTVDSYIRAVALERAQALAREAGREGDQQVLDEAMVELLDDPKIQAEAARRMEVQAQVMKEALESL